MTKFFFGLDIGGTKIGLSVGTPDGQIIAANRLTVDHARSPENLLGECKHLLLQLAAKHADGDLSTIAALGAACPGPLDYIRGRFINPPNNPSLHGFALRDWLRANFPCPVAMMNDANAAALAEWLWGSASGANTAVFLTMSTGMGAGLIIDGRLFEGPLGLAGEIGSLRLRDTDDGPVGFGRRGSIEGYTSGPGMTQLAISEAIACVHSGVPSALVDAYRARATITPQELCEASRAGDPPARRVTDRISRELGRTLAILTDVLNPEVFVLGTIGAAYPDLFIPGAMKTLREEAVAAAVEIVRVVPSILPDRGNQQAMAVAWHALNGNPGTRAQ
jgi:glucokinase